MLSNLIGKKHHTPAEHVTKLEGALGKLSGSEDKAGVRAQEDVAKYLGRVRVMLCGGGEQAPDLTVGPSLVAELVRQGTLGQLVHRLDLMEFESRKDAVAVWGAALRTAVGGGEAGGAAVEACRAQPELLEKLLSGYEVPHLALSCGAMLREALRHEPLAVRLMRGPRFKDFFAYVELPTFEVASDAFESFRELLTRHKAAVAQYLRQHYEPFFAQYSALLRSENYVTRRQAVKLLGEVLLEKANVEVLMRYIGDVGNLCTMMNLLKDQSRAIQFEAFHVFKVFVANPSKPEDVVAILRTNRDKLLRYLADFQNDRDDEHFAEEKAILVRLLGELGGGGANEGAAGGQ